MRAGARMLSARAAAVLVAIAACVLAWRSGGGAEGAAELPRAADLADASPAAPLALAPPAPLAQRAEGAEGYEVALRLASATNDARIEAPNVEAGQKLLRKHWRKMRPPWLSLAGDGARFVTSIALRTSATETQWSMPAGGGKEWSPDAKVWNMNEGSFDQRDALVAMAPSSFTFRVTVPAGARLTFAEGTVNAMREAAIYVVTVVDAKNVRHEIYRRRLSPAAARRWTEASCSLSPFAGQTVELRLSTETAPATARELALAADAGVELDAHADAGADGGPAEEDPLDVPGPPLTLWGNPTLLARTIPRVPYNVLWIVVDALRPDVIASFHDDAEDAAKRGAPSPPLEALLPRVPGLTPAIDDLARRGVRFTNAYSAGSWTRPGTLAMLSGARSSELGVDTQRWALLQADSARFYASEPPLLPLALRRQGVATHAFVNNFFMAGYAPVGLDMGFEHTADHRYRTRDTQEITRDATAWIRANKETRFFVFVNYDSPHEPYDPPPHLLDRVPPPPAGPADPTTRLYMAEAAKDDEAIGVLMRSLGDAGLRDRTVIVVTADHGETLSPAHAGTSALDKMPVRYHHAAGNYEETTRIPILIVAPGLLPEDREVKARVRNTDLAPTIAELLGLEQHPRASGVSLVGLAKGQKEPEERVVVSEGRGTRAIIHGRHRLLVREGLARITTVEKKTVVADEELFDLVDDPGERRDLSKDRPELVAEMRARLDAALQNVPVAGAASTTPEGAAAGPPVIHLRFAGGSRHRRVSGSIAVGDAKTKARSFTVEPVDLGRDTFKIEGSKVDVALVTSASVPVGFDIVVDPPGTPVTWDLYLDDAAWPDDAVFGGPFGLPAPVLRKGIATDEARRAAHSTMLPHIDPRRDAGVFVSRERRGERGERGEGEASLDEGAEEMTRLLRAWGYAHAPGQRPSDRGK